MQSVEPTPSEYLYKQFLYWRPREKGAKTSQETEDQRLCCRSIFPRNVRSCTQAVSPTWLSKHGLEKSYNNRQANVDRETSGILNPKQRTTVN